MLQFSKTVTIPESEIEINAIRAQGSGGQNVNKVSTAIHLRFDIKASSLPDIYKNRLLQKKDRRITGDGIVIIKAQRFRTQEKNREDALQRLGELIQSVMVARKKRIATQPSAAAKEKRLETKNRQSRIKALRGRVKNDE